MLTPVCSVRLLTPGHATLSGNSISIIKQCTGQIKPSKTIRNKQQAKSKEQGARSREHVSRLEGVRLDCWSLCVCVCVCVCMRTVRNV